MGLVEGNPKSGRPRSVTLSQRGIKLLQAVQIKQIEQRVSSGSAWKDSGYVFTDTLGNPFDSLVFTKEFKRILRTTDLPQSLSFHSMRHAHVSLLAHMGVNAKAISERVGHSSVSFTLDVYGHMLPTMQEHAAEAIDEALAD